MIISKNIGNCHSNCWTETVDTSMVSECHRWHEEMFEHFKQNSKDSSFIVSWCTTLENKIISHWQICSSDWPLYNRIIVNSSKSCLHLYQRTQFKTRTNNKKPSWKLMEKMSCFPLLLRQNPKSSKVSKTMARIYFLSLLSMCEFRETRSWED